MDKSELQITQRIAAAIERVADIIAAQPPAPKPKRAPTAKKEVPEFFDAFWLYWPQHRRVARLAAEKAWRALNPSGLLAENIFRDIASKIDSPGWTKDSGKYIPNPATYINQRRWEDEECVDPGAINYTRQEGGDDQW